MNATMNTLYQCQPGQRLNIDGTIRTLVSLRVCYGRALQLTLSSPLPDCTSTLYDVTERNVYRVQILPTG